VFFFEKRKFLEKQVEDPGRQVSPAARKKTKNSARRRVTGKDKDAEEGEPTSEAARKTRVLRDGGESLSS